MQPHRPAARRVGMSLPKPFLAAAVAAALTAVLPAPAGVPAPPAPTVPVVAEAPYVAPVAPPIVRPAPVKPARVPVVAPPRDTRRGTPYFRTPAAAMRYLARAYNAHDDKRLAYVTTREARDNLIAMRGYAPALALIGCTPNAGDYMCSFTHTLAKPSAGHRRGQATFLVGPAYRHGWYMTVLESCGDGD